MARWFLRLFLLGAVICLGANFVIRYFISPARQAKILEVGTTEPPANEASFHAALDAGNKAFSDGQYTDALDRFADAEQSAKQLTDAQYEFLKKARLQIAQTYEQSGENSAAGGVYRILANCALAQGNLLLASHQYEESLERARDAKDFSGSVIEGKRDVHQASAYLAANALEGLQRFPDAEQELEREIDYLKSSAGDNEGAIADTTLSLASTYLHAQDWPPAEQKLLEAIDMDNRLLTRFSTPQEMLANAPVVNPLIISRNWAQYNLVIAYHLGEDTDTALAKAQDFYSDLSTHPVDPFHPVVYHAGDFANLGLTIATEAKKQDAIDLWRGRGGVLIGASVSTASLHPVRAQ